MLENEGATADVEEVEAEAPKSIDDTIRETLQSLRERGLEPAGDIGEDVPDAPEAAPEVAPRDAQGKFAKAPEAAPEAAETRPAPNTWRKEVAEKWGTLPPEVQAEVERREADFHKGIEQYRQAAQFQQDFGRAIQPFEATLRSTGLDPVGAVTQLMATDHLLRYGQPQEKLAKIQQMARYYNVDLGQVGSYEPQAVDPQVAQLQQQVQQLSSYLQQQQLQGQQAEQYSLNSEIAAFAADPNHGHFEQVREHMAALLQAGLAKDLHDAYAQAVYANPTTRATVSQQEARAAREEAAKKAQVARQAASVNVRSRPALPTDVPAGQSMEETIRATLRRVTGA
jgi:hypothetical protein